MKTKEQLQAAVDAIKSVCIEYGVMLVGTCNREGIDGEISIFDAHDAVLPHGSDNQVSDDWPGSMTVQNIGEPIEDIEADKLFTYSNDVDAMAALLDAYAHDLRRGAQVYIHAQTLIKAAELIRSRK